MCVPERMAAAPRRVVVTGIGLVTPLGVGVEASWRRLLAGGCGVVRLPSLQGLPTEIGAPVPRGEAPDGFDLNRCSLSRPGDSSSLSPFIHFALAAADEALRSSGWQPADERALERAGVRWRSMFYSWPNMPAPLSTDNAVETLRRNRPPPRRPARSALITTLLVHAVGQIN